MSLSKPANFDQAQSVVPCDVCEEESGEHYCTVCRQTLCDGCKKYHKKVAATKDHEVVPRVQMASAVASTACSRHPNQTVTLQCEPCQILVCIKCVAGEHSGHHMKTLSDIYEDEKAKVEKDIRDIEQKTIPSLTKAMKDISPKREEYKKAVSGIRKEFDAEVKELKSRLDKIHADRLKRLSEAETTGLGQFDLIQQELEDQKRSCIDDVSEYKSKIASKNQAQILSYARMRGKKAHKHGAPVLQFPSPPQIQRMKSEIMDISELLAKLKISIAAARPGTNKQFVEPTIFSHFKSELQGHPSICVTDEGKAWIGEYGSRELRLVDRNGKVLRTRQTKNRPFTLAITSSGDILLCPRGDDSMTVMKLRADGTECPLLDVSPSCINGVSVTEDGDILVCSSDGRVMRCNGDGGNVRQIYDGKKNDTALHAIELPDSNICISDFANKAFVIIDKNGKILKQINKPMGVEIFSPWGLACDSLGNILSVDYDNDRVYIISQNGEVRKLVGKSHGIKDPQWLAVDSDDNMWVAQRDGNIKVVKYLV